VQVPASLVGRILDGRYRIEGKLGQGGIGVVYRAEHLALGRLVAVKVLLDEVAALPDQRARFVREARVLSALAHPHVVPITDFGIADGMPYLVMELLEGRTLEQLLAAEAPLAPERALDIFRQILRGLSFAHARGIAHRDLKPANVFLQSLPDYGDHVRLLDFGLAKFLDVEGGRSDETLTRAGIVFGTPAYMAPEQAAGETADARADVYGAGVMLFELLTGKRPFYAGSRADLLRAHLLAAPPRPATVRPELVLAPELEALLDRALAKDAGARFTDAGALLAALDAVPVPAARLVPASASAAVSGDAESSRAPDPCAVVVQAGEPSGGQRETEAVAGAQQNPVLPSGAARVEAGVGGLVARASSRFAARGALWVLAVLGAVAAVAAFAFAGGAHDDDAAYHSQRSGQEHLSDGGTVGPERQPTPAARAPGDAVDGRGGAGRTAADVQPPRANGGGSQGLVATADAGPRDVPGAEGAARGVDSDRGLDGVGDGLASAQRPAADRERARDPFRTGRLPVPLARARRLIEAGRFDRRDYLELQRFVASNRQDVRGHLVMAAGMMAMGWREDALARFRLAYQIDPTARGHVASFRLLCELAGYERQRERVVALIASVWGDEAGPRFDEEIRRAADPLHRGRLAALRAAVLAAVAAPPTPAR
jgi:serine/threonine-protein kinase